MNSKYDKIAPDYDKTRRADPVLVKRLISLLKIENGLNYLDLACGSGNYTSSMAQLGGNWSGIDLSNLMLGKARAKSAAVDWVQGNVDALPFGGQSFHGVTCTLAIHHFASLEDSFREVRRVIRNGRFVLFTSTAEQMEGYWLCHYFPAALHRSIEQMPRMNSIRSALVNAGFAVSQIESYFVHRELEDSFLFSGKQRPEVYLDPEVRRGISTFSSLADEIEIKDGCDHLKQDIKTGKINEVIRKYENDLGDYCFIVSEPI